MTKTLKISIIIAVPIIIAAVVWYVIINSTQNDVYTEKPLDDTMTTMPLTGSPFCIEVAPGLRFKFDTGADISSISRADLEKIKEMGYEVKESSMPVTGRDGYGKYIFSAKRATVTLPIGGYKPYTDTARVTRLVYTGKPSNLIHNVDFAINDDDISTIGLDLLEKFKIECIYALQAIEFHNELPDGYQHVTDMETSASIFDYFWPSHRSYITVSVNEVPQIYLLDTGLQKTSIKMPSRENIRAKHDLRKDTVRTMTHEFEVLVDDRAWVNFGNRSGALKVCYYDNSENEYQINPLNLFQQDILIDIDGHTIFFRPTDKESYITEELSIDSISPEENADELLQ